MKEKPIKQERKIRHWTDYLADDDCAAIVLFCVFLALFNLYFLHGGAL